MRIQMLKLDAGPDAVRRPGEIHEVTKDEGDRLIADGAALAAPARETAAVAAPENTAANAVRPAFRPVGGGWYELADGRRVRGKKAAEKAAGA